MPKSEVNGIVSDEVGNVGVLRTGESIADIVDEGQTLFVVRQVANLDDKIVLHFARFTLDRNFRTASRPTTRCPTATRLLDTGERDARQSASTKAPASFALLIVKLSVMLEVAIFHLALIFIVNAKPTKQNEFITVLDEFQAKYSRKKDLQRNAQFERILNGKGESRSHRQAEEALRLSGGKRFPPLCFSQEHKKGGKLSPPMGGSNSSQRWFDKVDHPFYDFRLHLGVVVVSLYPVMEDLW